MATISITDGKTTASVTTDSTQPPEQLLKAMLGAWADDMLACAFQSITVTAATEPAAAPEPEYKFAVGQRVKTQCNSYGNITKRMKSQDGSMSLYRIRYCPNGKRSELVWTDNELTAAEEPACESPA
jgi:hypothetical protein